MVPWKIRLIYKNGDIVTSIIKNSEPTESFALNAHQGLCHFKRLLTLISGGRFPEILLVIYKQVDEDALQKRS